MIVSSAVLAFGLLVGCGNEEGNPESNQDLIQEQDMQAPSSDVPTANEEDTLGEELDVEVDVNPDEESTETDDSKKE